MILTFYNKSINGFPLSKIHIIETIWTITVFENKEESIMQLDPRLVFFYDYILYIKNKNLRILVSLYVTVLYNIITIHYQL